MTWSIPILAMMISLSSFGAYAAAPKCHSVFSPNNLNIVLAQTPRTRKLGFDINLFRQNTAARMYVEMASRGLLMPQASGELLARGLIQPNGGLCAPTAITNVLGAMTAQARNFLYFREKAPDLLEHLLGEHFKMTGEEALHNANVKVLAAVVVGSLPEIAARTGYHNKASELTIEVRHPNLKLDPTGLSQALKGDSIAVGSVRPVNPEAVGSSVAHAATLLRIDTVKRLLYLSDSNAPNKILEVPYRYQEGRGNITFNMPVTYGRHPVELIETTIFSRTLD